MEIKSLTSLQLISLYGDILKELKDRKVIRTNNFIGEIGEYLAIEFYSNTKGFSKLQAAPPSTKNFDAISKNGDRYSIKCTTKTTTGVFYGVEKEMAKPLFEYVIVVMLDEQLDVKLILELTWEQFMKHKKWHSRMNAWNMSITNTLINDAKTIYKKS